MDIRSLLDRYLGSRPGTGQGLDPRAGGVGGATIGLRKSYNEYAMDAMARGDQPMSWEEWLPSQGYQMMPGGLVRAIQGPQQQQFEPQPRSGGRPF